MQNTRKMVVAAAALLSSLALGGCGLFSTSGLNRYERNDPDRIAARVQANVVATTLYTQADPAETAVFSALLFDADGRQFYGPEVLFNGERVEPAATTSNNPSRYVKSGIPYAAGNTFTVSVQGNTATTPPAIAPLKVTSPPRSTGTNDNNEPITLTYFEQPANQGVTVSWTGGDPNRPVYIVIWGDPTSENGQNVRRLYVRDNPAQSPTDSDNYGLPIANTGSFTIPAELTERVVGADGQTTTRTVPTFNNLHERDIRYFSIYVVQRTEIVKNGPLEVSSLSVATAVAGVKPLTQTN